MKTVKINLKLFTEELFVAISSDNEEDIKELNEKFIHFFNNQSNDIKIKVLDYIDNLKIVKENKLLKNYFKNFSM